MHACGMADWASHIVQNKRNAKCLSHGGDFPRFPDASVPQNIRHQDLGDMLLQPVANLPPGH